MVSALRTSQLWDRAFPLEVRRATASSAPTSSCMARVSACILPLRCLSLHRSGVRLCGCRRCCPQILLAQPAIICRPLFFVSQAAMFVFFLRGYDARTSPGCDYAAGLAGYGFVQLACFAALESQRMGSGFLFPGMQPSRARRVGACCLRHRRLRPRVTGAA